jgi:hypothetical protein
MTFHSASAARIHAVKLKVGESNERQTTPKNFVLPTPLLGAKKSKTMGVTFLI